MVPLFAKVERFAAEAETMPDTAAGCACGDDGTVFPFFIGEAAYYEQGKVRRRARWGRMEPPPYGAPL